MQDEIRRIFPQVGGFSIESPSTINYNCIAWAADDLDHDWWPDQGGKAYWPVDVPREVTLQAFVAAYRTLGYETCDDGTLENDVEKIAIYVDTQSIPTHAAKQLTNGRWTSKLGQAVDIEHSTPEALSGDRYGRVAVYMKRLRPHE